MFGCINRVHLSTSINTLLIRSTSAKQHQCSSRHPAGRKKCWTICKQATKTTSRPCSHRLCGVSPQRPPVASTHKHTGPLTAAALLPPLRRSCWPGTPRRSKTLATGSCMATPSSSLDPPGELLLVPGLGWALPPPVADVPVASSLLSRCVLAAASAGRQRLSWPGEARMVSSSRGLCESSSWCCPSTRTHPLVPYPCWLQSCWPAAVSPRVMP